MTGQSYLHRTHTRVSPKSLTSTKQTCGTSVVKATQEEGCATCIHALEHGKHKVCFVVLVQEACSVDVSAAMTS